MSNSCFPQDLLVLVLIRLPPKSLGRFKIVSKSWNFLISSSEFIGFHLRYQFSIQKKLYRLLTKDVDYLPEVIYVSSIYHNKFLTTEHETHLAEYSINIGQDLELGCEIQRLYNPCESHAPGMTPMLVGSCNGLLCQLGEYEISLCNPLTKTSWVLPKSPLFQLKGDHRPPRKVAFFGFGYDDVHDTYKVFLASGPPHEYEERRGHQPPDSNYAYEVHSLRTNKWIIVSCSDQDLHDYFIHSGKNLDGVLINGALHWILWNFQNKKKNCILAFDLRVDKLDILPLPEAVDEHYNIMLPVLNGCLLLSDQIVSFDPETIVDMWLMKDYALKDSWTRIRIRNSPHLLVSETPVALVEDNHHKKKLIYHDIRRWNSRKIMILLSYDIESHQVEEFPTPPSTILFHNNPKQLQFVASLVQPHPPPSSG